jgi:hypothetical protein
MQLAYSHFEGQTVTVLSIKEFHRNEEGSELYRIAICGPCKCLTEVGQRAIFDLIDNTRLNLVSKQIEKFIHFSVT